MFPLRAWTPEETAKLADMIEAGARNRRIAAILNRSQGSVMAKRHRLTAKNKPV